MKKDYLAAIIAGSLTAVFLWPSLKNIEIGGKFFVFVLPVLVPILWIIGLWVAKFLAKWLSFIYQFAKFIVVGFLNTAIDFGVLNLLSIFTGLTSGFLVGGVNVPGFLLAATNSYFWNKFWVFKKQGEPRSKDYSDFFTFAVVILIGALINGGIVVLVTTYISPFGTLSAERWLNIAKVVATVISLFWNFIGFKFFVFNKNVTGSLQKISAEKF